jgi:hypothetical protein
VATVRIAYNNSDMIKLLIERGTMIGQDKPASEIEEIDNKI